MAIREVVVEFRAVTSGFVSSLKGILESMGRVSTEVANIQQRAQTAGQQISSSLAGAAVVADELNLSIAQTTYVFQRLGTLVGAFGAAFLGAFALSLRSAIEFEQAIRNVNSLLKLSEEAVGRLSREVLDLATTVPQGPNVLAKALYEIVSTGFGSAEAMELLKVSAQAASAGLTTTEQSVGALLTVLRAYNLSAEEATRVSDIMFRAVDVGRFTFQDLSAQMGDFISLAAQMGVTLEEAAAAFATMTLSGIPASEAATSLAAVLREMLKPTEKMTAFLNQLGFASAEAAIQQIGFAQVIKEAGRATRDSKQALAGYFNEARALRGVLPLVNQDSQVFINVLEKIRNSAGATQLAFQEQAKSFAFQFAIMRNNITVFAQNALLPFLPLFTRLSELMVNVTRTSLELSRAFPIVTQAVVALTAAMAVLSGIMGGLLVTAAPIVLLLNTGLVPQIGALALRVSGLINILQRVINLRIVGTIAAIGIALELVNRITGGAITMLGRYMAEVTKLASAVISGSKSASQAAAEMKFNVAETFLTMATRDIPLVRRSIQEFIKEMELLRRQALTVRTEEEFEKTKEKINEVAESFKRVVRARAELLGIPEASINRILQNMEFVRDSVEQTARVSRVRFVEVFNEVARVFEASGRWVRDFRVSFGEQLVMNFRKLPEFLRGIPETLSGLRQGVESGTVSLDEARKKVDELILGMQDLREQVGNTFGKPGAAGVAAVLVSQINEAVLELQKFKAVLGVIRPQKVVAEGEKETVEAIRKEFEEINRLRQRTVALAVSQVNLEFAQRMAAARRGDELIMIEEQRNRRILEINEQSGRKMLEIINDLMRRMERAIEGGSGRLSQIQEGIARAVTEEERKQLEEEAAALREELARRNEEFERLETERVNILSEINNARARLMEDGARRVVSILESLRDEGVRIEQEIFRTVVQIAEESIRTAEQVGGRPRIPSVFEGLIEITQLEGGRVIEAERNVFSARLETLRLTEELRLALLRRTAESETSAIDKRLQILEMAMNTENRIRRIDLQIFEDEQRRRVDALRKSTEEQIRQIERSRLTMTRRQREAAIEELRRQAAEEELRIQEEVAERRRQIELEEISQEITFQRARIQAARNRAEVQIRIAWEEAQSQIRLAELQTEERIAQIQFELRARENQTRASIMMARLETQSRIAQARMELETRLALIEAETRARLAAGQITKEQAQAIFQNIDSIRRRFSEFEQTMTRATEEVVQGLLQGLQVERQQADQLIGILRQQLDIRRAIIQQTFELQRQRILDQLEVEVERARQRIRELERERERIQRERGGFVPDRGMVALVSPAQVDEIRDAGGQIAAAFDRFGGQIVDSARSVVQAIQDAVAEVPVVEARVRPDEGFRQPSMIVNVEGTEVKFTPEEERLFADFIRRLVGPEGRRVFDEWARRGV